MRNDTLFCVYRRLPRFIVAPGGSHHAVIGLKAGRWYCNHAWFPDSCDSLRLGCLRKVAFREASLELAYSPPDPSHSSQSRACRTWAKAPRKQLPMPPLERTKEPIEELEIKDWPFTACIILHTNRGEASLSLVQRAYSTEGLISWPKLSACQWNTPATYVTRLV